MQEKNSPEDLFKTACYLASRGKQIEAELAVRKSLSIRQDYPIAWVILSAILLAQGRETDAEQAGKNAISQCKNLKMTWPKMRSIIYSHGVSRGASWKDPRRVMIEASNISEWGMLLETLGKASKQGIEEIASSQEKLEDNIEFQSKIDTPKGRTPTKTTDVSAKKYESAEKRFQGHKDERVEQELISESMKEYTPTRTIGVTEKKKYEPATKRFQSHEERRDEPERQHEQMKEYTPSRTISVTEKKEYEPATKHFDEPKVFGESIEPIKKEDAITWFADADILLKKGNLDEAQEAFLKGLRIDPSSGDAWLRVSSIMMGKQKYDEAIVALQHASQKLPRHSDVWYQLGYCYQKLNKWQDSLDPLKQATQLDMNKADFWFALGLSEYHTGQYQLSAKSLLRALRISPNHKNALFYLAMCMEKQGNRNHSLSLYLKLLNIGGLKPEMLERMAGAFDRFQRPREAREARRQATIARRAGIE